MFDHIPQRYPDIPPPRMVFKMVPDYGNVACYIHPHPTAWFFGVPATDGIICIRENLKSDDTLRYNIAHEYRHHIQLHETVWINYLKQRNSLVEFKNKYNSLSDKEKQIKYYSEFPHELDALLSANFHEPCERSLEIQNWVEEAMFG